MNVKAILMWLPAAILFPCIVLCQELSLKQLIRAHCSTIGSIHSADISYSTDVTPGSSVSICNEKCRWQKFGDAQLFESWFDERTDEGIESRYRRSFLDGVTQKSFFARMPDQLDSIQINDQKGLLAVTAPASRRIPDVGIYEHMMLRFSLVQTDEWRTLDEIEAEFPSIRLMGMAEVDGVLCYHIRAMHPGVAGQLEGSCLDIFLDGSRGFFARRVIKTIRMNGEAVLFQATVKEFKPAEGGLWFPVDIERSAISQSSGEPDGRIYRHRVTSMAINQSAPFGEEVFQYPKNALVHVLDQPPFLMNPTPNDVLLIGDDGKVVRTFPKGTDQLKTFLERHRGVALANQQPDEVTSVGTHGIGRYLAVFGVILVCGIVIWRRSLQKGQK